MSGSTLASCRSVVANEILKVQCRRAVAPNRRQGRSQHLLVMIQEALPQVGNRNRSERQKGGRLRRKLGVDLRRDALGLDRIIRHTAANLARAITIVDMPAAVIKIVGDTSNPAAQGATLLLLRRQGTHSS